MSNNTGDEAGDAEARPPAWPQFDEDGSAAGAPADGEQWPDVEPEPGGDAAAEAESEAGQETAEPEGSAAAVREPEQSEPVPSESPEPESPELSESPAPGPGAPEPPESPGESTTVLPAVGNEPGTGRGQHGHEGTEPAEPPGTGRPGDPRPDAEDTAELEARQHRRHGESAVQPETTTESTTFIPPVRADTPRPVPWERPEESTGSMPPVAGPPPHGRRTDMMSLPEEDDPDTTEPGVTGRGTGAQPVTGEEYETAEQYETAEEPQTGEQPEPVAGEDAPAERAEPMRVQPNGEPAASEPPEPGPRRRKRGLLVGGAVVLVIVLAAGALVGVPGLADRLGVPLPGALRSTDPPPQPAAVHRTLRGLPAGQGPTPQGVRGQLAKVTANPALAKLTGTVIDPQTGKQLWARAPTQALAPGSTAKVLTVAAALLRLDPNKRLVTKVVQGKDPSTAVLVGGGDPTINSLPRGKQSVYWNAPHLQDLVDQVRKASGGRIKRVLVDQHRYRGPTAAKGWSPADIKAGNYAPIVPAMTDGGRTDPTKAEGTPRTPNPGGELLGRLAGDIGAEPGGGGAAPQGAKVLGQIRSAPISDLAANLLTISDNVLAEVLGRELAIATGQPPTFQGATTAVRQVLTGNGFDTSGMRMADASGLSTQDRLPARLIGQVLAAATGDGARSARLRPMLDGLPVAGGTGSLADRYRSGDSARARGWVRAKTGTLTGVSALAGYAQTKDGRLLVFTLMSNGGALAKQRPALDAIAAELYQCGCR